MVELFCPFISLLAPMLWGQLMRVVCTISTNEVTSAKTFHNISHSFKPGRCTVLPPCSPSYVAIFVSFEIDKYMST